MHSLFIHSTKIKKYIEVVAKEAGQKLNFRRKCGRFSTIKRRISSFLRIDTMRFSDFKSVSIIPIARASLPCLKDFRRV